MRQELLKILTTDDIQEILDAGELLWQDYKEPNAVNILNQLLEDNGCPPSIGLRTLMKSFSREYNEFHSKDVYSASYTITDSDVMKYTTEGAMLSNAKRHIAKTIADDIIKQFEVEETMTDDGRKRFTYKFKIVKL